MAGLRSSSFECEKVLPYSLLIWSTKHSFSIAVKPALLLKSRFEVNFWVVSNKPETSLIGTTDLSNPLN